MSEHIYRWSNVLAATVFVTLAVAKVYEVVSLYDPLILGTALSMFGFGHIVLGKVSCR